MYGIDNNPNAVKCSNINSKVLNISENYQSKFLDLNKLFQQNFDKSDETLAELKY